MSKYVPRFNVTNTRPYIETVNGPYVNGIFDGTCAAGTLVLGYTSEVFERIKKEKMYMFSTLRFNHQVLDELAERLQRRSLCHVYYCGNTGSDAVEAALKVSYDKNGKNKIIAREGAFHGSTVSANSLGNYPSFKQYYGMFSENIIRIPFDQTITTMSDLCRYELDFIKQQKDVGAILIEPFPSIVYDCRYEFDDPSCYNELREYCDHNNITLIFDEVYTGAGKTGKYIFTEYLTIDPDLVCLAKGITGGIVPLSVLLGKKDIFSKFKHGITHAGHYLGCVTACEIYDTVELLLPSINSKSETYSKYFDNTLGFLFSLKVDRYIQHDDIFVNKSPKGDRISFTPPLNTTDDDLRICLKIIKENQ